MCRGRERERETPDQHSIKEQASKQLSKQLSDATDLVHVSGLGRVEVVHVPVESVKVSACGERRS
jgi:acetolactate synthase small subunit